MKGWNWFLTIYIIAFVINLIVTFSEESPNKLVWILMLLGDVFAIFSLIAFTDNKKFTPAKWFKFTVIPVYLLFALFNLFSLITFVIFSFSTYFSNLPLSLIDLAFLILPVIAVYPVVKTFTNFKFKRIRKINYMRVYCWFLAVVLGSFFIGMLFEITKWTFYDYITVISIPVSGLSLYAFVYKKRVLSVLFWQVYFWYNIASTIFEFLDSLEFFRKSISIPDFLRSFNNEPVPLMSWIIFMPLFLPAYYVLYKIAFDRNFFKADKS